MPIALTDPEKVEVLLALLGENRKQAEWVKDLDFKIVYYTVGFFVATVAWASTHPPAPGRSGELAAIPLVLAALAVLFLARNHARHAALNREFARLTAALGLAGAGAYADKPLFPESWTPDLPFHLGRGMYAAFVVVAALLAAWLTWR